MTIPNVSSTTRSILHMSTVTPKLAYINGNAIPVFEICTPKAPGKPSNNLYYYRPHYPGFRPIGSDCFVQPDGSSVTVTESIRGRKGIHILSERDEEGRELYTPPLSWYERINNAGETYNAEEDESALVEETDDEVSVEEGEKGWDDFEDTKEHQGYRVVKHF